MGNSSWFVTCKIGEEGVKLFDEKAAKERRTRTRHLEWLIEEYLEKVRRENYKVS